MDSFAALVGGQIGRVLPFDQDPVVWFDTKVPYTVLSVLLIPLWVFAMALGGAYDRRIVGLGSEEYRRIFDSAARLLGLVAIIAFVFDLALARPYVAFALPLSAVVCLMSRYAARRRLHALRRRGQCSHKVVVVGSGDHTQGLIRHLTRAPYAGFAVLGVCIPEGSATFDIDGVSIPVLGTPEEAAVIVQRLQADAVAMSDASSPGALQTLAWDLEGSGVDLLVVPGLTDVAGPRIVVRPVAGLPLLHVDEPQLSGFRRGLKQLVDRTSAAVILLILSPFLLSFAIAVRLTSPGPALYRQVRVGRHGEHFILRKFRSMTQEADSQRADLVERSETEGVLFKDPNDDRRTKLGVFLRRYSIDELPQLWNVVVGDMSMVGPRPPLPEEVEKYEPHVRRRLLVKPGLTGLWQVSGRSDLSWEESVRLDLYYVENWSPAMDVAIMWKTVAAVLWGRGAY